MPFPLRRAMRAEKLDHSVNGFHEGRDSVKGLLPRMAKNFLSASRYTGLPLKYWEAKTPTPRKASVATPSAVGATSLIMATRFTSPPIVLSSTRELSPKACSRHKAQPGRRTTKTSVGLVLPLSKVSA